MTTEELSGHRPAAPQSAPPQSAAPQPARVVGPGVLPSTAGSDPEPDGGLDIGIDLDGVCYDFAGGLREWLVAARGRDRSSMSDPQGWHFYSAQWGLTVPEFLAECTAAVDAGHLFAVGDPLDGVADGIGRLLAAGHRVHLVTDRAGFGAPGAAEANTRRWLAAHGIAFTTLTLSGDKTVVPTDVFIDDRVENVVALTAAGVRTYVRDQAWNRHLDGPPDDRVADFTTFVDRILGRP
jgi:hypothetical protein